MELHSGPGRGKDDARGAPKDAVRGAPVCSWIRTAIGGCGSRRPTDGVKWIHEVPARRRSPRRNVAYEL